MTTVALGCRLRPPAAACCRLLCRLLPPAADALLTLSSSNADVVVGLDIIQLHGAEGWDIAHKLNRPSFRVVHMESGVSAGDVQAQLKAKSPNWATLAGRVGRSPSAQA